MTNASSGHNHAHNKKRRRAPPVRRNNLDIAAIKARRAIHRAFLNWYLARESDLPVKLYLRGRTDRGLNFGFVGMTDHLGLYIRPYGLSVWARGDGRNPGCNQDLVFDLDNDPRRYPQGFACSWCIDHHLKQRPDVPFTRYFPSREALWADELFEPLATWMVERLLPSRWVELSYDDDGSLLGADLRREGDPIDDREVVAVFLDNGRAT